MTHANYNRRFRSKKQGYVRLSSKKLVSFELEMFTMLFLLNEWNALLKTLIPTVCYLAVIV